MVNGQKVIVVMPAYNAQHTLKATYTDIPHHIVDAVILVDDASNDQTALLAQKLGINHVIVHDKNLGYGGNQKTCYNKALDLGGDIIIMLHPDYQYNPKLIPAMVDLLANNVFDVVLGSRILGKGALAGGMPFYKYVANRALTLIQNLLLNQKLSEYHTGYRAFKASVLQNTNYQANSNNFVFDNQILSQIIYKNYRIGEIACPTKYFPEASSINLTKSIQYGLGVLGVCSQHLAQKWGLVKLKRYG